MVKKKLSKQILGIAICILSGIATFVALVALGALALYLIWNLFLAKVILTISPIAYWQSVMAVALLWLSLLATNIFRAMAQSYTQQMQMRMLAKRMEEMAKSMNQQGVDDVLRHFRQQE